MTSSPIAMAFREMVRKAFRRSFPGFKDNGNGNGNGKIKIEYYRRHEVPRSKYRGPVDPEHQRKLAAWTFEGAMAHRPRSIDLELSPCASIVVPPDEVPPFEIDSPDADDRTAVDPVDGSFPPLPYPLDIQNPS